VLPAPWFCQHRAAIFFRPSRRKECDESAEPAPLAADSEARRSEEHRAHLRDVAYRILGSASDAEDAVQEAWLRLSRTDVSDVLNLRAWTTNVTRRGGLDRLESRGTRREDMSAELPEPAADGPP